MNTGLKVSLYAGALTIASLAAISFWPKPEKEEIMKGFIDSIWIEMPRHDVRVKDPVAGIWEEAWIDTTYWMRISKPYTDQERVVEVHPSMYARYKDRVGSYIELGDSAKFAEDSIQAAKEKEEWYKKLDERNKQ